MRAQNYSTLWIAMLSFAQFPDSVSIVLLVIDVFVTFMKYSLLRVFVTSAMNGMLFLGSNKIMCAYKRLHKQCIVPLRLLE